MLAEIILGAITTPRAVLLERAQRAALVLGVDAAKRMQAHMIATAPDVQARAVAPPPPRRVHVEVVTLDPSKLSQPRKG
jgi:hypothetical protein